MTGEFPALSQVFVAERDAFLANSLRFAAQPVKDPRSSSGLSAQSFLILTCLLTYLQTYCTHIPHVLIVVAHLTVFWRQLLSSYFCYLPLTACTSCQRWIEHVQFCPVICAGNQYSTATRDVRKCLQMGHAATSIFADTVGCSFVCFCGCGCFLRKTNVFTAMFLLSSNNNTQNSGCIGFCTCHIIKVCPWFQYIINIITVAGSVDVVPDS